MSAIYVPERIGVLNLIAKQMPATHQQEIEISLYDRASSEDIRKQFPDLNEELIAKGRCNVVSELFNVMMKEYPPLLRLPGTAFSHHENSLKHRREHIIPMKHLDQKEESNAPLEYQAGDFMTEQHLFNLRYQEPWIETECLRLGAAGYRSFSPQSANTPQFFHVLNRENRSQNGIDLTRQARERGYNPGNNFIVGSGDPENGKYMSEVMMMKKQFDYSQVRDAPVNDGHPMRVKYLKSIPNVGIPLECEFYYAPVILKFVTYLRPSWVTGEPESLELFA